MPLNQTKVNQFNLKPNGDHFRCILSFDEEAFIYLIVL